MQLSVSLIWLKVCELSNWYKFIAFISSNKYWLLASVNIGK